MPDDIVIAIDQCLCIHSTVQAIDTILQVLLYQRRIIPEPLNFIVGSETEQAQLFASAYDEIATVLRKIFRSQNSLAVKELLLCIGSSCYAPREIYRIPVRICKLHLNTDEANGCGKYCGTLTQKEKRKIFSSLMAQAEESQPGCGSALDKAFLFVCTTNHQIMDGVEGLEEDPNLHPELPKLMTSAKAANSNRGVFTALMLRTPCSELMEDGHERSENCWFRLTRHLKRFN